jgi:hypothetical protein
MKKFIYKNIRTKRQAHATHNTLDKAQLSTPDADLSPNSRALWNAPSRSFGTDPQDASDGAHQMHF